MDKLLEILQDMNFQEDVLDDLVFESAEYMADVACATGWEGRLHFLRNIAGMEDEEILNILTGDIAPDEDR